MLKRIASDPETPSRILIGLSHYFDFSVATNPNTPIFIVRNLLHPKEDTKDMRKQISEAVVENLNAPAEIVFELAFSEYSEVRGKARKHTNFNMKIFVEEFVQ